MFSKHFTYIRPYVPAAAALCLLGSCTLYRPAPLDLARDSAQWLQVSQSLCPSGRAISRTELHSIGLLLNPELNKARLSYARSTAVAKYAGLWQDPSISLEGERVLKEGFFNKNIGMSLSIPVTGLPRLAKQVAEQYKEADYWDMRAKERDYLRRLDTLGNGIMIAHERHRLMKERLRVMQDEMASIEKLHRAGEISFSEYQAASQRLIDTRKEELEMDKTHLEKHLELSALVGLHPSCRHFELSGGLPSGIPAALPVPTPDVLLSSPSLRSEIAGYGATETDLRREIRRQYPEISLSPSVGKEDGNHKFGLGVGMDLPLWNRNKESIAKASAERAIKKSDVISMWRSLQHEAAGLYDRQRQAIRHCVTEHEGLVQLEAAAKREEELFRAGESSLPQLAEARHELYQRHLSYLECLGELLDVQTALFYLNPNN